MVVLFEAFHFRLYPQLPCHMASRHVHVRDSSATPLFSVASMADDGQSSHLKMEYLASHLNVKIDRTALLAELPQLLKPYSCCLADELMAHFMTVLNENTCNPLA